MIIGNFERTRNNHYHFQEKTEFSEDEFILVVKFSPKNSLETTLARVINIGPHNSWGTIPRYVPLGPSILGWYP